MEGADGGRGWQGWGRTWLEVTGFWVRTHMDTYGPPWGPMGAPGCPSHFPQFSGFGPGPFSWKVSVVVRGEQAVPIEQKRHGHVKSINDAL